MTTEREEILSRWQLWEENPDERRMFDSEVERLYAGEPLLLIASALTIMAQMSPPQGSYCQTCKIYSNEIIRHLRKQQDDQK